MDILLEAVGMIIFLVLVGGLVAYGVRHRGRISKWLENLDATPNAEEKEERIKKLTREREDIDAELASLKSETQEPE